MLISFIDGLKIKIENLFHKKSRECESKIYQKIIENSGPKNDEM